MDPDPEMSHSSVNNSDVGSSEQEQEHLQETSDESSLNYSEKTAASACPPNDSVAEEESYSVSSTLGENNESSIRSRVHVASLQIPHLHIPHGQGTNQKSENGCASRRASQMQDIHITNDSDEEEDLQTVKITVTDTYHLKDDNYLLAFSTGDDDDPENVMNSKNLCDSPEDNNASEQLISENEIITGDPIEVVHCSNCKTVVPKDSTSLKSFQEFLPSQYYDTGSGNVVNVMIVDAIAEVFKIQWTCPNFSEISDRSDLFLCLDCASTLAQLYQLYNQFASLAVKSKSFLSAVINFQKELQVDGGGAIGPEDEDEQSNRGGDAGCDNPDTEQIVTSISPHDLLQNGVGSELKVTTPTWKRKRAIKKVHRYGDDDDDEEENCGTDNNRNNDGDYKISPIKLQKSVDLFQDLNSDETSNTSLDKAIPPKKRNKKQRKEQKIDFVVERESKVQKLCELDKATSIKVEGVDLDLESENNEDSLSFDPLIVSTISENVGGGDGQEEEMDSSEPLQSVLQRLRGPFKKGSEVGKYLKCKECNKKFMFPVQLRIHLNSQRHRDRVKLVQNESQESEDKNESRSIKIKLRKPNRKGSHSTKNSKSKSLTCDECGKSFSTNKELRRHSKSHDDGVKAGDCDRCGKNFKTLGGLKIHYAAHVRDDNKYSCKDCGKKFRKQEALELHEKTDHGGFKPHACPHCDKCFRLKDKLKLHVMVIHDKKKPFPCPKCEKAFRTKYHLKIHDVSQHIQGGDTSVGCSQCKRKFPDRESLEKHVLVHEQEKPFICSVCSKGFHTSARLKLHEKSHQEMPSCLCPICGRAYKHVRDLKLHEVVHQDESTYRFGCGDCPRRFYRIDLLRVHQSNEKHFSTEVVGPTVSKSQAGKDTSFFQIHEDALDENDEEDENETDGEAPKVVHIPPSNLSKKKRKSPKEKSVRISSSSSHLQGSSSPPTREREMTVMHPHATVVYHPSTMLQLHVDQSGIIPSSSGGHLRNEMASGTGTLVTAPQNIPSNLSLTSHQHRFVQNEAQSYPTTAYIINPARDRQNIGHHHHQGGTAIQIQPGGSISTSVIPHSHIQFGSGNSNNTIYTLRDASGNLINVSNIGGPNESMGFDIISSFIKELQ